jgi:PHP family Zn ribbon phosphoesterase
VLIDASKEELSAAVVDQRIAEAIIRVREGTISVIPGYDGIYGRLVLPKQEKETNSTAPDSTHQVPEIQRIKPPPGRIQQTGLSDFW